jgi:hypothetical protein
MSLVYDHSPISRRVIFRKPSVLPECLIRRNRAVNACSADFHLENSLPYTSALPLATDDPCSISTVYSGWEFLIVSNACLASSIGQFSAQKLADCEIALFTDVPDKHKNTPARFSSLEK